MHRFLLTRLRARHRAVVALFGVLVAVAAPQSWGLGLGEIELDSALNQKFHATIELFDASGLEPNEIIVTLGSAEDFQRVGVERFFFLTSLSFQVDHGRDGNPVIVVTSSRPITEPYLNFLVKVMWPNGRLLKEYTVLLDPPTFSEAAAPAVSAPARERTAATQGRVQRDTGTRVRVAPAPAPAPEPSQPLAREGDFQGGEYGMTNRNDTLWSIASRARPAGNVTVQQTMLAIARMNPEAFIRGNINLLKAGYVLRLPDETEVRSLSARDAVQEVARHEAEWRAYNRGEAVPDRTAVASSDTTSGLRSPVDTREGTTAASDVEASDGELRIVAEDGDSTTGVGGRLASAELDAALEETDRLGRQVEELTYQLDREKELAANEIAVRERQIEVKDQQIAELQAQLAAARAAQQAQEAAAPPAQSQNQSTQAQATPWWQSPVVMYGGAGVLVLLLVGGMMVSRRRRVAEAENDYFDAEEAFAEEERIEPDLSEPEETTGAAWARDDEDVLAEAQDTEGFDEELEGSQTSDVIGEADIYIAYGRYPQAIGLLLGVLEDAPERNDVRMKLLEVYAETGDRAAFDEHMTLLVEYCEDQEALLEARELESQFGEEAIPLDDVMSGGPEPAEADDEADTAADAAVEPDERAAGIVLDEAAPEDTREEAEDTGSALDFELELDELDGEPEADDDAESRGAGDQLGGDLGIDFNPDEPEEAQDATSQDATSQDEGPEGEDADAQALDHIEYEPAGDEISLDDLEEDAAAAGGETEELTIDSDLERAAVAISDEAAAVSASTDGADTDVAVAEADEDLLEDLELDSAAKGAEEEFEFEDEGDSANTKLDLARAYIDMGDADGARDILNEVLDEGNSDQQQKAQAMLESL